MEIFNINKNLHYLEKNSKQEQLLINSINFYIELKLYSTALAITSGLLILKLEKTATEDKPVLFETVKQYFLPYNVDFTSFNVLQSLEIN